MSDDSQNDGTSFLTVDSAAKVFEALLSDDSEDTDTRETPQESQEDPESETVEDSEQETTGSDESVENEATDDEPNEDDPQPKTRRIKINGEDVEVTEEELEKGYSRTADYTRKTQELSEKRKAFEAEDQAVRGERQQYATALKRLEEALKEMTPQEPDWAKLQTEDPDSFAPTWAAWQQHQRRIEAVAEERKRADEKVQGDQHKAFGEYARAEQEKFFEAAPELKDEKKWTEEKTKLVTFAKSSGFSPQELEQVYDHRVLLVLRKAMQFDALQKNKPAVKQKLEGKEVVVRPGSKPSKTTVSELTRSRQRLAKTGSIEDAAGVFMHLID